MTKGGRVALWLLLATLIVALIGVAIWFSPAGRTVTETIVTGVVLADDSDSQKQVPIADAEVMVSGGKKTAKGKSDEMGYFKVVLPTQFRERTVSISIRQPEFRPWESAIVDPKELLVARLTSVRMKTALSPGPILSIANVRLRYTVKATNTQNIGSIVRPFEVKNAGNVPCNKSATCSPDKKWRATLTSVAYDAGDTNEFINVRASCVAGPCAFTRIESSNIASPGRRIHLSILNWSDSVTYLVEAEVSRTMMSDMVRQSFPAIFGNDMDFTLPPTAEGPSLEAELNGTSIVFPLGPNLLLSWATCKAETAPDKTRLYRCELKPSFAFR